MEGNWGQGFKGPHMEGRNRLEVVPDRCSTSRPSSRIARCGALGQEAEDAQGVDTGQSFSSSPFSLTVAANASLDDHSNHSNGSHFPKGHTTLLVPPLPYDWAGLGVRTVSDDESPLHRAIVKLTWATRQSGARVLMVAQSAGLSPLVPRRRRACACSAWQTQTRPWSRAASAI
jgi:hypothetical protein